MVFVFFEAEVKFKFKFNATATATARSPVCGCRRAGAGEAGSRDTPQVPLRGPAQPLAAVRSGACEAVPRKQCAPTRVGSFAPSMALYGPATLPPPPPDSAAVLIGEQEQGLEPGREPEPERLGGRLGGGGQCRATLGTYDQAPIPTITELPNLQIRRRSPNAWIHRDRPRNQKSRCYSRLPVVCRGAVRLGWRDPPPHGCGGGALSDRNLAV